MSYQGGQPFSAETLLQFSNLELTSYISSLSLQFAVLGHVDAARKLVTQLNAFDIYHDSTTRLEPLWILWDETREWPGREQEHVIRRLAGEIEGKAGDGGGRDDTRERDDSNEVPTTPSHSDIRDHVRALEQDYIHCWQFNGKKEPEGLTKKHIEGTLTIPEAAQIINKLVQVPEHPFHHASSGSAAMDTSAALTNALDLRLYIDERLGHEELAAEVPGVEEILRLIGSRLDANSALYYLAQSRRAWSVLRRGALADALGIDQDRVAQFWRDIEPTVVSRFREGRSPLSEMTMRDMVRALDHNSRTAPDAIEYFQEAGWEIPDTIIHEPASASEIRDLEARLDGAQLPDDYKEFLSITNGLGESWGGITTNPPLHPTSEVLMCTEHPFKDLALDIPWVAWCVGKNRHQDATEDWPTIGPEALEIGAEDTENLWLVPPDSVNKVKERVRRILENDSYSEDFMNSWRRAVTDFVDGGQGLEKFYEPGWCCLSIPSGGVPDSYVYESFSRWLRIQVEASRGDSQSKFMKENRFFGYCLVK